jgi:hypothetical protein
MSKQKTFASSEMKTVQGDPQYQPKKTFKQLGFSGMDIPENPSPIVQEPTPQAIDGIPGEKCYTLRAIYQRKSIALRRGAILTVIEKPAGDSVLLRDGLGKEYSLHLSDVAKLGGSKGKDVPDVTL